MKPSGYSSMLASTANGHQGLQNVLALMLSALNTLAFPAPASEPTPAPIPEPTVEPDRQVIPCAKISLD